MNERRIARLQEQIKQRLAEVLLRDLADPKLGMVTITRVELDSEFTRCVAYWSVIGDDLQKQKTRGVLQRARGLCQRSMAAAIHTRTVPHLEFVFDAGIEQAIHLNQVLAELKQEREAREREHPAPEPDEAAGSPPNATEDPDRPDAPAGPTA